MDSNYLIKNCLYYRKQDECEFCVQGFYLKDDYCEKADALNCLTYIDKKTCKTCSQFYGLKENVDRVDCVLVEIPNCI